MDFCADGNVLLVGGSNDSARVGAVWVFTRSSGLWTQQGSKISGAGIVGNAWFGRSVNLSFDCTAGVIGGMFDSGNTGAAWFYSLQRAVNPSLKPFASKSSIDIKHVSDTGVVSSEVEKIFKRQSGRIISCLTRAMGSGRIDLAETVVQEALIKALRVWPAYGIPENPAGWILQVARNDALNILRREGIFQEKESEIQFFSYEDTPAPKEFHFGEEIRDDELRMIFTCCHPSLPEAGRIALTLKTLGGLSIHEIARAFLTKQETIEQRLVRAKQKIKDEAIPFEVPEPSELAERLESVLIVIYLMYNEGYGATQGDDLIRQELCREAIRLGSILSDHPLTSSPKVHALLALMYLQSSRDVARIGDEGEIIFLAQQDRALWDKGMIALGLRHLEQAMVGEEVSTYHLQALIAMTHAAARSFEETDWQAIVDFYEQLYEIQPSEVVALNRAVAIGMAKGPTEGIKMLDALVNEKGLQNYYLFFGAYADFHFKLGRFDEAEKYYRKGISLVGTVPERKYLMKRLSELNKKKRSSAGSLTFFN